MKEYSLTRSYEMFSRAEQIVPHGYQGPQNPRFYDFGHAPVFLKRGEGCHVWDVDGNEYIDYLCALGAIVLGMRHPVVEEAARKQSETGDCMTFPSDKWLELAEYMVNRIPKMDWAIFAKNGSDVTSYLTQVARAHTGKPGIVMIHHAYHGFHFWCSSPASSIPPEYQSHIYPFHFNDIEDFEKVVQDHKGQLAAVMLTPVRHDIASDQELPEPGFFNKIREICDKEGMLLLLDDVRCGFRYHENGSAEYFGVDADMIAFGKAMSNGYPISVAMGKKKLMDAARTFLFIGTHFYSAAPMAASLACLKEIKASGAVAHMLQMGEMLRKGILDSAKAHGIGVRYSGHPTMPLLMFEDDPLFAKAKRFCALAAERGVIFHPIHNWFLSAAHKKKDIEKTIGVCDECFKML